MDHVCAALGRLMILQDHVVSGRRGRYDQVAFAEQNRLVLDAFGEVTLLFESLVPLREIGLHLGLLPEAEGMGARGAR